MGLIDASRVETNETGSSFRTFILDQILRDLDEEQSSKGYTEISYTATVFVSKITIWDSVAKLKKRVEVNFTYSMPFVTLVAKSIYSEDGTQVVSTITDTITYNSNKTIDKISTVITRP